MYRYPASAKSAFLCIKEEAGKNICLSAIGRDKKSKTLEQRFDLHYCGSSDFSLCVQINEHTMMKPAKPPVPPVSPGHMPVTPPSPPVAPPSPAYPPIPAGATPVTCVDKKPANKCAKKLKKGKCYKKKVGGSNTKGKCLLTCGAPCYTLPGR